MYNFKVTAQTNQTSQYWPT